jgi:hypothetical protein
VAADNRFGVWPYRRSGDRLLMGRVPAVARYEGKAGRTIPVALPEHQTEST